MTEIIALVSGKGGSGKTATALALGHFAADLGVKTLLIDADVGTHGMSYFFVDRLAGTERQRSLTRPHLEGQDVVQIGDYLHFLPSVPSITARTFKAIDESLLNAAESAIRSLAPQYDLVLIDCQAGVTKMTGQVLRLSSTALVVTEADPVSIWAVNDLIDELREYLPGTVRGVVNKAMKEEQAYFEALVDITQRIRFVGQLPFDLDVRRAFFRREVPVNLKEPSTFLLSLASIMARVSESLEAAAAKFERWQRDEQVGRMCRELDSLQRRRDELLTGRRVSPFGILASSPQLLMMMMMTAVVGLGISFGLFLLATSNAELEVRYVVVAALGGGMALVFLVMLPIWARVNMLSPVNRSMGDFDRLREVESRIAELEVGIESAPAEESAALKERRSGEEPGEDRPGRPE